MKTRWPACEPNGLETTLLPTKTEFDHTMLPKMVQHGCEPSKGGIPSGIEIAMGHQSTGGYFE